LEAKRVHIHAEFLIFLEVLCQKKGKKEKKKKKIFLKFKNFWFGFPIGSWFLHSRYFII